DRFARNYANPRVAGGGINAGWGRRHVSQSPPRANPGRSIALASPGRHCRIRTSPRFSNAADAGNAMPPWRGESGSVSHAPYGYRYVNKQEGCGEARFAIVVDEARMVQQVYAWVGQDRCTRSRSVSPPAPGRCADPNG